MVHSPRAEETEQAPEIGTRQTSSSPVTRPTLFPASSLSTSKPTYSHPADRGVTLTTLPSLSGTCLLLTLRSDTLSLLSPQVTALGPPVPGVLLVRGPHGLHPRDLRHRHVPEGLVVRHALVAVHRDVYDDRPVRTFRLRQGALQLADAFRPDDVRPEALGVGRQVYRQHVARLFFGVQADGAVLAVAVLGPEPLGADGAGEGAYRREAGVVHEDDGELVALLDGGDDLGVHHQVRAVADHHVDLALGGGHLDAEAARDLVSHRRVAVLDVVALGIACAPQLVKVAGHRSRRAHDHVLGIGERVHSPNGRALGGQRPVLQRVEPLDLPVPLPVQALALLPVLALH